MAMRSGHRRHPCRLCMPRGVMRNGRIPSMADEQSWTRKVSANLRAQYVANATNPRFYLHIIAAREKTAAGAGGFGGGGAIRRGNRRVCGASVGVGAAGSSQTARGMHIDMCKHATVRYGGGGRRAGQCGVRLGHWRGRWARGMHTLMCMHTQAARKPARNRKPGIAPHRTTIFRRNPP